MIDNQLQQAIKNIENIEKQILHKQKTLTLIAPEEQMRIELQIGELIKQKNMLEEECQAIQKKYANFIDISEKEAEEIIFELSDLPNRIRNTEELCEEIIVALRQIQLVIHENHQTALTKLKTIFSTTPPFFLYS